MVNKTTKNLNRKYEGKLCTIEANFDMTGKILSVDVKVHPVTGGNREIFGRLALLGNELRTMVSMMKADADPARLAKIAKGLVDSQKEEQEEINSVK